MNLVTERLPVVNALSDTPAARGAIAQATEALRKVFAK